MPRKGFTYCHLSLFICEFFMQSFFSKNMKPKNKKIKKYKYTIKRQQLFKYMK